MISSGTFNNFKYFAKIAVILLFVFLLLISITTLSTSEAILLACIIAVSVLIIENIIFINTQSTDPLNCDQCLVQKVDESNTQKLEKFEK